jgi:endoglucanase
MKSPHHLPKSPHHFVPSLPGLMLLAAFAFATAAAPAAPAKPSADFVRARGGELVDGEGRPLHLRGVNLGNWLLPEGYMFEFARVNSPRLIETTFAQLVGDAAAQRFWDRWRDTFITREDIRFIRRAGFNSVRIPFSYRLLVDPAQPEWRGPGWAMLDRAIGWCREEGLYVVLDLHAAPGGQTGDNIDDSRGYPFLFDSEDDQALAVALWKEIATRYQDETTVLGYDLLNEPVAPYFEKKHFDPLIEPLYRRMVAAIRSVDRHHVCILAGSGWVSDFAIFGAPFDSNLLYTFHAYYEQPTAARLKPYLAFREKYQVPLWLGESGENNDAWISSFRRALEDNDIGWCFWPYKRMGNSACVATIPPPDQWAGIKGYAEAPRGTYDEIRAARPAAAALAPAALGQLLENVRLERCRINAGYLEALGLAVPDGTVR